MKATELRIGNLVWNEIQEIAVSVNLKILSEQLQGKTVWYPIPLTEEWLIKFGFKRDNNIWIHGSFSNPNAPLFYYKDLDLKIIEGSLVFPGWRIIKITHVHQLQNLYFALTRKELTLKTD